MKITTVTYTLVDPKSDVNSTVTTLFHTTVGEDSLAEAREFVFNLIPQEDLNIVDLKTRTIVRTVNKQGEFITFLIQEIDTDTIRNTFS